MSVAKVDLRTAEKIKQVAERIPGAKWLIPDPYDPLSMIQPIAGMARPIKGIFKSKVLSDLAVTPERKILWGKIKNHLTDLLLNKKTAPDEAYLFGSYATKKPNPKDVDIFSFYPSSTAGEQKKRAAKELLANLDIPLDYGTYTSGRSTPLAEFLQLGGKQRYGAESQWIKILSLLGLVGTSQIHGREERR